MRVFRMEYIILAPSKKDQINKRKYKNEKALECTSFLSSSLENVMNKVRYADVTTGVALTCNWVL